LYSTIGNAPVVNQPEWSKGVVDVVNLKSRIYSVWCNGNEDFYYSGDARALNEAIRKYSEVRAGVRRLILLPGTGNTQTINGKPIRIDWQLNVPSGIYKAFAKKDHAEMTVYVNGLKPKAARDPKQVAQWLRALDDNAFRTRDAAQKELEKLGNDAKPFLRAALKSQPTAETRRRIETLLGKLRIVDVTDLEIPKGIEVVTVDDLLAEYWKGLKNPDAYLSGYALYGLTRFASYDAKIVPALIEMSKKDKREHVRRITASCLCDLDIPKEPVVAALKEGLDDPNANIRNHFQATLARIEKAKEKHGRAKEKHGQEDRRKRELAIAKEIAELKKAIGERK
jgi:hypothetical protein